jgi:NAD(P)-dependent dehydrogenase (short-subunit alcohol dehydrogenase family)
MTGSSGRGRLSGKIALITGTAGGQGRAAALRFADEGARIVGCDLDEAGAKETANLVEAARGSMRSLAPVNLSDEDHVKAWIDFAVSEYGDFDILYNNASGGRWGPIESMALGDWNYTLANELTLVFLAIKHAVPVFRRKEGGCILNIASVAGMQASNPGAFAHGATKAAVIALTHDMAVELAPLGVRVNAISPGPVHVEALAERYAAIGDSLRARTLNQRIGQPEDVVAAALYLCSDEAIQVTGVNLPVDGGQSASPGGGRPTMEPSRVQFH